MTHCFKCGQDMTEVAGCDDNRMITFADGAEVEPIPQGEAERDRTHQEIVADYERQIENGGRGKLTVEDIRGEMENFEDNWEPAGWNNRACHDCGADAGEYHHPGCDSEECPRCQGQYLTCSCVTEEKDEIWQSA